MMTFQKKIQESSIVSLATLILIISIESNSFKILTKKTAIEAAWSRKMEWKGTFL